MKTPRILFGYSFTRDDPDYSPEEISHIEAADETYIPPEQFIASILVEIMDKHMGEEEAV